jgi:hypothetical protein
LHAVLSVGAPPVTQQRRAFGGVLHFYPPIYPPLKFEGLWICAQVLKTVRVIGTLEISQRLVFFLQINPVLM